MEECRDEQRALALPDRETFAAALPEPDEHALWRAGRPTGHRLPAGKRYLSLKDFSDAKGGTWTAAEQLTFQVRHFLPHDDGHTLEFPEGTVFLRGGGEVAKLFDVNFAEA